MAKAEAYVDGLNDVLRALRALPKEANAELRKASQVIADRYMVPAWRDAAMEAGSWGPAIADSVKARRDRIPKVAIGGNKKAVSGGASATMLRYPSSSGQTRESFAPFEKTNWINQTRTYISPAMREWSEAVDKVVKKWETM